MTRTKRGQHLNPISLLYEALKSAIEFAHNNSIKFQEGPHFQTMKTLLEEYHENGTFMRTIKTTSNYMQANQKVGVHMENRFLLQAEKLPETVLEAVLGRPLGSIIEIHPELDCKIIEKIDNTPAGIVIHVEKKLVNVGDFISARG